MLIYYSDHTGSNTVEQVKVTDTPIFGEVCESLLQLKT